MKLRDRLLEDLLKREHKGWQAYLFAVNIAVFALVMRLLIAPESAGLQFITFFPAVAISAVLFGTGPSLFCTVICAFFATYFLFPPYRVFSFELQSHTVIAVLVFCTDGLIVSLAIGLLLSWVLLLR